MSDEEKDLPASGKKRNEKRQEGSVIKSQDVSSTVLLASGLFGLLAVGGHLTKGFGNVMVRCFREAGKSSSFQEMSAPLKVIFDQELFLYLGAFFVLLLVMAVSGQMIQFGWLFTTKPLELKLDRLNPTSGLKRLFSLKKLVQVVTSVVKLIVILTFMYSATRELFFEPVFVRSVTVAELGGFLVKVAWEIGWRVLLALAAIATVDYFYQKWQWEKDNRMSHKEVKDEFRQTEGAPEVKRRQRKIMRERSIRRMMEDLADSTIVITNPTHYAVALKYKRGETPAPMVTAKGMRLIALKIKEKAKELRLPILENPALAQGLYKHTKVGDAIPVIFYQTVARILATLQRQGFVDSSGTEPANEEGDEVREDDENPDEGLRS